MIPLGVLASARPNGSPWVTDGLMVHLDGQQYPGSGSTWSDLSGSGNHATLIGSGVSQSSGMIVFAANSYASIPYQLPTDFTVEVAMRFDPGATSWMIVFGAETWDASAGYMALDEVRFRRPGDSGGITASVGLASAVHIVAFTKSGTALRIYGDGSLATTGTGANTTNNATTYLGARHGNGGTGYADAKPCRFGEARLYSRALTGAEITQNFEASRGRYGL